MFTCAVRLLDICRVDRLVFSSSSWPSLCRLSWLPPSNKLPACLPPCLPACRHGPNSSSLPPVIAAASCRSGSSRWHSHGSSDAPVTPAVAARPLPGLVAVRALRVLFVAFSCSSWPFSCADYFGGIRKKYAEKNAHFFVTQADYSKMCLQI